jgi:hypothetical protein
MTNDELIRRFETDTFPEDSFHHADHVRLAFAYLSQYPPLEALDKFSAALKRYAAARGKSQLYHETITHAYFFLIRERMARVSATDSPATDSRALDSRTNDSSTNDSHTNDSRINDWDEFARRNPDLLEWKNGLLTRYYHEATLQSDLARTVFLFPDKCC